MKVLIAGGAGFIGYHLALFHLERGDSVTILDNCFKTGGLPDSDFRELVNRAKVEYLHVDLTKSILDARTLRGTEIVYHLAAINGTRLFYELPYQVARANLLMTLNLLDALEENSACRLIYASSSEVYADCEKVGLLKIPTSEETPVVFTQPTGARFSYGTSKFMGEFLCLQFGKRTGIPTSVLRYHNVYGPRMGHNHVIPEFISRMRERENPLSVYGGQETRAFCYVDDAVGMTYEIATTDGCEWEIFHVGNSSEEITINSLALQMMEKLGVELEIVECGGRSGSVSRRCPDTTKLKRMTGFECKVSLIEGLDRTIRWYLQNGSIPVGRKSREEKAEERIVPELGK